MKKQLQILIVEDSEDDILLMLYHIKKGGYEIDYKRIETAEAMKVALNEKMWDVVLSDYTMPNFNGLEALMLLKETGIDIPFIVVSGTIGEDVAVEMMKAGAHDYLMKNNLMRLIPAIERELRESNNRAQQRLLEQKQKQFEAKLYLQAMALESAANSIIITDKQGIIKWANQACTELTGYNFEEIIDQNPRIFKSGLQDNSFYKNLWKIISEKKVWQNEIINRRKDGTLYTEEMTITPVQNLDGEIINFIAIKQNITERKQAELLLKEKNIELMALNEELKQKNNEYNVLNEEYITINRELKNSSAYNRMLFDLATVGLVLAKTTGELVDVNQAYADIINYTIEETLKLTYWDITPKKYAEQEQFKLNNLNEKGFYGPYEKEYINKSGKLVPVRMSGRIVEKNGQKFILSSIEDITLQKQFEEEIQQNEFRLNTLFELNNQKTLPLNELYNLILNKAIELCKSKIGFLGFVDETEENVEIFSWSDSAMAECTIPNRILNFVVSQSGLWAEVIRQRKSIILNDYSEPNILKKGLPSGHVKLNNVISVPFFNNGKITTVVALANKESDYNNTDIIQLNLLLDGMWTIIKEKKYQSELVTAKEKAEESNRLKSAFLANMSHEIRTPMNGILGFSSLLREPGLESEDQQEYIKIIQKSGDRMLNILSEIIDISKIESGVINVNINDVNINQQLEFVYKLLKPDADVKALNFLFKNSLSDTEAVFQTDGEKLCGILSNLVKNAIKYTDNGTVEFGYNYIDTHGCASLQFFVKDTGIGIPKDRQEAIFERFIQADIEDIQARQGAGLGLSIAKAFVELLGGKIWVESEQGKGSTFYFTLPYNAKLKEEIGVQNYVTSNKANNKVNLQDSGLKILIVEDDEISEMLIFKIIKKYCKEIIEARTGKEAVEICCKHPDIDLILMDIQMPDLNGYEATRQIRQFNNDVVIIAQTAFGLTGDREKAIKAGCNDYIEKPIIIDELLTLIQKHKKK